MSPLWTLVIAIASSAVAGAASWLIATTRKVAALEAKPPANGLTPHKELIHNLGAIRTALDEAARRREALLADLLERTKAIEVRLETEEKYRWPSQDKAMEIATEAIKDGTQATRALLSWLTQGGGGGGPKTDS